MLYACIIELFRIVTPWLTDWSRVGLLTPVSGYSCSGVVRPWRLVVVKLGEM